MDDIIYFQLTTYSHQFDSRTNYSTVGQIRNLICNFSNAQIFS